MGGVLSPITSPSELNKRITIQAPTRAADGMGGFSVSWPDIATVWAAVWPTSATEAIQSGQATTTTLYRIRIRYRAVMRAGWRVSYAGRLFNVASIVDSSSEHKWLDLICKEAA